MKLFHISHTDLDGYGCQLITKEYFKEGSFYNANYGIEVKLTIKKVLNELLSFKEEEILFLKNFTVGILAWFPPLQFQQVLLFF